MTGKQSYPPLSRMCNRARYEPAGSAIQSCSVGEQHWYAILPGITVGCISARAVTVHVAKDIGVGTGGARGALAPSLSRKGGRKEVSAPPLLGSHIISRSR